VRVVYFSLHSLKQISHLRFQYTAAAPSAAKSCLDPAVCSMVVPADFGCGNMVIPADFGGANMVVPDDFGGGNMVVTYNILTTQWSSLGHESSLSLSESSQCRQFQSRKSPEFFKSSLCRNFIAKMTYFFASCLSCRLHSRNGESYVEPRHFVRQNHLVRRFV
jgi:hypothetical protein